MRDKPINIALVDDHTLLRDALAVTINNFENCNVMLVANNGKQLIERLNLTNLPDLIILDVGMPVMDGYQTAEWLSKNHPSIRMLILTMHDEELVIIRLLNLGARGFLIKDISNAELRLAITTIMETGYYGGGHVTGKLFKLLKHEANNSLIGNINLTDEELQFLELTGTDMTYPEIAKQMKTTSRRVDSLRDALFEKLDVGSRVGLVIFGIKNAIIKLKN